MKMFARTLSTMQARLFGDADGVDDLSDVDRETVARRLREVEREKREVREELESLHARYQRVVARAERADETALDVVRGDLSRVVEAAAVARARHRRTRLQHRFLLLVAAPDRSPRSLADLDVDLHDESTGVRAPLWVAPGHLDPPRVRNDDPIDGDDLAARVRGELGDVDAAVEAVVTAGRTDAPVPTLPELLDADAGDDCDEYLITEAAGSVDDEETEGAPSRVLASRQDERES
ncbi:hypothetical protein [Halorubellus litoreus]|uniref:Uncharacterized protein n=1 Tax=Halorubellus litoreus TaxID=755308 RepID=A0ABD5VL70_9EURY